MPFPLLPEDRLPLLTRMGVVRRKAGVYGFSKGLGRIARGDRGRVNGHEKGSSVVRTRDRKGYPKRWIIKRQEKILGMA